MMPSHAFAHADPHAGQNGTGLLSRGDLTASVSDVDAPGSSHCPWSWCRSETATTVGAVHVVAHVGVGTAVQVPPDELIVYLVAVDHERPSVIIELTSGDSMALVLDVDQALRLTAAVRTVVDAIAR